MKKDQIIILKDRGVISISGKDTKEFLQNIITNDINIVDKDSSIFSGIFTPQGKYLYEFFIIKADNGYFLDCSEDFVSELKFFLEKYKLNLDIQINDISNKYVVGIISNKRFEELKKELNKSTQTIIYRSSQFFEDPRSKKLGTRILSNLEKLYLTIKKLSLKIVENKYYFSEAHEAGIPIKKLKRLQNNLFGLEANFEEFSAIDFKKGCYIGQENTARMKLKDKLRKKLLPLTSQENLEIGSDITLEGSLIGKLLIDNPYPFGLINIFDKKVSDLKNKEILVGQHKARLI